MALSKTQIDKLGERLKSGTSTAADLRELDEHRRSFSPEYEQVIATIERALGITPSGRRAKTVPSIVSKLQRESIRLSQIQDIAGGRIVVEDAPEQNRAVEILRNAFQNATVVDRREKPSYGYRAVHVIARVRGKPIEIQVRTTLQHQWAAVSEKYSDLIPDLKYGGGNADIRNALETTSAAAARIERLEMSLQKTEPSEHAEVRRDLQSVRDTLMAMLHMMLDELERHRLT
ncbi:MAG TPA: hypothetical protein VGJ78_26010 [Vicinamibacterales bacterium]